MNNKKRLSIIVIIILVFVAIVGYWLFQKTSPSESALESTAQPFVGDPSVLPKKSSPPPKFVPKTAKQKRWLEMGTQMDVQEVNFYGRVVDQYDQPVVDAIVPYELSGSALGGSNGAGRRITDVNGEFKIEGREGSGLLLKTISHPEIEFGYSIPASTRTTWDMPHVRTMAVYGFQPSEGANEVLWSDTSPENPYVFKAWRIAEESVQAAKNLKVGEHSNRLPYEKIYTLDFTLPLREQAQEGENDGQLRLLFKREADAEDITQRWEARLIPVDGGIQVTKDPYMNIAPEAGYESEIHIVREKTGYDSIDNLPNQQFYFKANNGQVYGSLFVSFNAKGSDGEMKFNIKYKLNIDGERILVQAKSKQ